VSGLLSLPPGAATQSLGASRQLNVRLVNSLGVVVRSQQVTTSGQSANYLFEKIKSGVPDFYMMLAE
jgi:hypothetical protein